MDARALLRAKKAEARIDHPYAAYSATGQLRCAVCAIPVQQWDAHLLTKQHRTSVAREKATQAEQSAKATAKRSASTVEERVGSSSKKARLEAAVQEGNEDDDEDVPRLPAGFFSEPSAGPSHAPGPSSTTTAPAPTASTGPSTTQGPDDPELDDFFASLAEPEGEHMDASGSVALGEGARTAGRMDDDERGVASYEAAPVRNVVGEEAEAEPEPAEEESEQERRARLAREEKEEIMDRLAEEERAQEDADSRVTALKARMELLKKRREAKGPNAADKSKRNQAKAGVTGATTSNGHTNA